MQLKVMGAIVSTVGVPGGERRPFPTEEAISEVLGVRGSG